LLKLYLKENQVVSTALTLHALNTGLTSCPKIRKKAVQGTTALSINRYTSTQHLLREANGEPVQFIHCKVTFFCVVLVLLKPKAESQLILMGVELS